MSILLIVLGGVLFAFLLLFLKIRFQSSVHEVSSNSTSLALVRATSSTVSTRSNTDKNLSVNSCSQDLINYPRMITMLKRILVNLSILEYKLAELEYLLIIKILNGTLAN
ncbi:kita-kyushu lung cancer antigen 1 [Suricata suricatta]|uniref:Cancer/testis antigen 83 n=1 Tax=Suricata suricatta TaxID=37032 RepID=A0A673VAE1_SURSU|nr:kita-kyushu lung cancer antigen 1 [Suricata suricatta]